MPSKTKKNSKAASRLSSAASPHTPSRLSSASSPHTPSLTSGADLDVNEEDLVCSLEEASNRFPNLIAKSAFIGRITDVRPESRGCKIWLSESSMVASSLSPGSIVSVSLAASGSRFTNPFPLSSFHGEFSKQFEVELADETASEVGNYFACATVFPSCKAVKNEVQLSSNLSYTMGCPALGRVVFVYPVRGQLLAGIVNGSNRPHNGIDYLSLLNCSELFLEFVPLKDRVKINSAMRSIRNPSTGKAHEESENGMMSSPKTPLSQLRLNSPGLNQSASARCSEAVSPLSHPDGTYANLFDVKEALRDESAKQLLQACAISWLYSRVLICGNFVAIPILSELCIFRVIRVNKVPPDINNKELIKERSYSFSPIDPETVCQAKDAYFVNHETVVNLCVPISSAAETPQRGGLPFVQIENEHVKTIAGHDMSKLGGLHKEYAVLKDIIISSSKNSLSSFGLRTTKGVLLHGPPGTGKTSLARLCVHDAGVNIFSVNGPEIVSQYYGESEQAMHKVFNSASQAAPAVVFIDELDAIAPSRKDGGEELSQRMVATLLNLMDGISRTDGLLIIAATNRPDSIEPALRRPGRLDREIEIGVPSPEQRLDILQTILSEMEHSLSYMQVQQLAMTTHGFVGADLASLCNEAALACLRRYAKFKQTFNKCHLQRSSSLHEGCSDGLLERSDCLGEMRDILRDSADSASSSVLELTSSLNNPSSSSFSGTEIAENMKNCTDNNMEKLSVEEEYILKVVFEDFEKAKLKVRPSAMREVVLEVPKVNWEDVGGQREVKNQLMEAVEWPQKHQDAFNRIGVRPPTGILLFGPPGCSKTLMARAVASEAGLNFLAVKGPELFSKWVGESEKAVRSLFAKARANAPSIIFFDEIDGLAIIRGKESDGVSVSDRVMSQLLVELDGLHQRVNVTVIAATNRPDKIDPALLRPGRFDRLLYVGPPNRTEREDIFRIHLRKILCSSDISIKELACLTDGCTGADISLICREAAVAAIEEDIDASAVTMQHLKSAIAQVQPSEIQSYQELSAKFQRLVHTSHGDDVGNIKCSSRSSEFSLWTRIKSSVQFFFRILVSE